MEQFKLYEVFKRYFCFCDPVIFLPWASEAVFSSVLLVKLLKRHGLYHRYQCSRVQNQTNWLLYELFRMVSFSFVQDPRQMSKLCRTL